MTEAACILVADDDKAIRTVLNQALSRLGYVVKSTGTASNLWRWIEEGVGDLVITDVVMPDDNGLDLLPRILAVRPNLKVIVMSARNTLMTAVQANERGAFEYLPKPFDLEALKLVVWKALNSEEEDARIYSALNSNLDETDQLPLIGRSPAMQEIYRVMARLMSTELTVTISGESAGATNVAHLIASPLAKGLFNKAIHQSAGWSIAEKDIDYDIQTELSDKLSKKLIGKTNKLNNLKIFVN